MNANFHDPVVTVRKVLADDLGVNVVTTTDSTFASDNPGAGMETPLILIEPIPGGRSDLYGYDFTCSIDVKCFALDWSSARRLAMRAHNVMCSLPARESIDDVQVGANPGALNYNNPNVSQFLATYDVTVRTSRP